MSETKSLQEYIEFHRGSVGSSKRLIIENVRVGFSGAAMFGAGLTGDILSVITENPNIAVPSTIVMFLGAVLVKDSYKEIMEEVDYVAEEQTKVTVAESELKSMQE